MADFAITRWRDLLPASSELARIWMLQVLKQVHDTLRDDLLDRALSRHESRTSGGPLVAPGAGPMDGISLLQAPRSL